MPHLSPISWPSAFLTFWILISLLSSLMWWLQLPTFPALLPPHKTMPHPLWHWN